MARCVETLKAPGNGSAFGGFPLSATRFCPNCGRPVPPENSFCAWCGAPMPVIAPPPAAPGLPPAPGAAPAAPPPPPGGAPAAFPPPMYAMPPKVDTSSLLSGTFDVWGKHFLAFFLVYLILTLVTGGLGILGAILIFGVPFVAGTVPIVGLPTTADIVALLGYELLVGLIGWLFASIVLGGVVDFSIRSHRGENVRLQDSLSKGLGRVLSIMGANLLVTLITLGILLLWVFLLFVGVLALVTTGNVAGGLAVVCGALLALPFVAVFVIYVDIALSLYAPVIMTEGAHATDSLNRSWALTKGHKWPILWSGVVLVILIAIIDAAFGYVGDLSGNVIVKLVTTAIASGVTGAWFAILTAVVYDGIIRRPQPSVWPATTMPPTYAPPPSPPR